MYLVGVVAFILGPGGGNRYLYCDRGADAERRPHGILAERSRLGGGTEGVCRDCQGGDP